MMNEVDKLIHCLVAAQETDYIGEPISQLEHALQAAYFAETAGHSQDVILASLFHDIGHFASPTQQVHMAELGLIHHQWIGAKLCFDAGFSAKVALLIASHVDAKRYLATKKPVYFERLSAASKKTFIFQGSLMSAKELQEFENQPYFKESLQVRMNDEKAKVVGLKVPDLNHYRSYFAQQLDQSRRSSPQERLHDNIDQQWIERFKTSLLAFETAQGLTVADRIAGS